MGTGNNINYHRLVNALDFYQGKGFEYLDLEWVTEEDTSYITKHDISKNFFINEKVLAGSAEQVFIEMFDNKRLPQGRFVGITPCFRDEKVDELHGNYFMKVELIDTLDVSEESLNEIIELALLFFGRYLPCERLQINHHQIDIIDSTSKIELGSYGIRDYDGMKWIYATGCAEPRLSKAIKQYVDKYLY